MGMGDTATLQKSEWAGVAVAVAAHVALGWALYLAAQADPVEITIPDRMVVSLAEDVALESTAPDPSAAPQAAVAPVLSPEPAPVIDPLPEPVTRPVERPVQQPVRQPRPTQRSTPTPRETPRQARSTPTPTPRQTQAARSGGGSLLGDNYMDGVSGGERNASRGTPAARFGASEAASLRSAISRQIRPYWAVPQGLDAEKLVTVLAWDLNSDGSLKGTPRVVSQSGITDANRNQAELHAERAIRAVQQAAPFKLPPEFYNEWKRISEWKFDRRT